MTTRRIVLDTIGANYAAVRQIPCLKFGYHNGPNSAWPVEALDEQRHRGELLAMFDVLGDSPRKASILDWERFDVQDPERLRWWVKERNAFAGDAVVYSNRDGMAGVLAALHNTGEYYRLLVADLTDNGQPAVNPPDYGLPPNVRLLGNQYAWAAKTGGPYDLSILYDPTWHTAPHPVHLAAAAVEAPAADAAPVEQLADAAPAVEQLADAAPAVAELADFPPAVEAATADPKEPAAADGATWFAAPSTVDGFPSGPTTSSGPELHIPDLSALTGLAGAATLQGTAAPEPDLARPYVPAPAVEAINHAAVGGWVKDGQHVADLFRGAGGAHVAHVVEEAMGAVLEFGRLLAAAGR